MSVEAKNLLAKLRLCPQAAEDMHGYFSEIAELFMNNYVISKRGINYEIIEIEYYLFTPAHPDVITYPRICIAGEWFFHQSGVDLTFATIGGKQFGGILIRGLREIEGARNQIFGPCKCVEVLWDKFNAFKAIPSEIPIIIPADGKVEIAPLTAYQRWIPVKNGNDAMAKTHKWIERIKNEGYVLLHGNSSNEDIHKILSLTFESKYRFFKEKSINHEDPSWKKYTSKPKTN